ncbi:unnamed protein product [Cuscuta epithymum]|uniref:K Homology domain-containing protein n=1 Tax=Cuscuta epithymum TaxID=186058 RepID=A0AAV0ECD0_9ASTE|nr:unnamed protein product [Cuscuta epithymum]
MAGQRSSYGKRSNSQTQSEYAENKRRNSFGSDNKERTSIDSEDTVYRYLCPLKKIGSIMGRGGDIIKQLRAETKSKIRIGETVPGCDERVVTIYSSSEETNELDGGGEGLVCPAHDALLKVHDRVSYEETGVDDHYSEEEGPQVTAKLLVPSDQIGCIIGKGGQIVQSIRSETGAQIRILKDKHLPACALDSDELLQISGEMHVVSKALYQVTSRLHKNPSRSQHLLASSAYPPGGSSLMGPSPGAQIVGLAPLAGPYGSYKDEGGEWPPRSVYAAPRHDSSPKEFILRLVCPNANVGGVIGKGGATINHIRQESRASIKVDSSIDEGDDCLIVISSKEIFDDTYSPTIEAALLLQPRCSEKVERDSGLSVYTIRLLVPSSCIGCLIGKGGSIINELRRITKANIRVLSRESLPNIAAEDDEMVLISGELDVSKDALVQVTSRLRANLFEREGGVSAAFVPLPSYLPMPIDPPDSFTKYESRDSRRHGHGHSSYSSGYGSARDMPPTDGYGRYSTFQSTSSPGYGAYEGYSVGCSGTPEPNTASHRKSYGY